jgi:uncharacterized damage-inducible protein DinB
MKSLLYASAVCFLLVTASTAVRAGDVKGFRADLLGQIGYAQKEIMELENAIPDAKMTWRPNAEVRSISEVYSHIAFGNYLFGKMAGFTLPEGVTLPNEEKQWETKSTDRKVIHEELAKSFEFLKGQISNMSDASLDEMVPFFGGSKASVRTVLLGLLAHLNQHLGQSIAYARMEGVVPPWTAAQMAAEKAKAEKK